MTSSSVRRCSWAASVACCVCLPSRTHVYLVPTTPTSTCRPSPTTRSRRRRTRHRRRRPAPTAHSRQRCRTSASTWKSAPHGRRLAATPVVTTRWCSTNGSSWRESSIGCCLSSFSPLQLSRSSSRLAFIRQRLVIRHEVCGVTLDSQPCDRLAWSIYAVNRHFISLLLWSSSSSSCCRSRCDKDCFHHLTTLHLSLCCESNVHESVFMSLSFRFLLMVFLNRWRGRPLFRWPEDSWE